MKADAQLISSAYQRLICCCSVPEGYGRRGASSKTKKNCFVSGAEVLKQRCSDFTSSLSSTDHQLRKHQLNREVFAKFSSPTAFALPPSSVPAPLRWHSICRLTNDIWFVRAPKRGGSRGQMVNEVSDLCQDPKVPGWRHSWKDGGDTEPKGLL